MSRTWTYGICNCWDDCSLCVFAFLCPACAFGKNASAVGESCFLFTLTQYVPALNLFTRAYIRKRIREEKQIEGTFCDDLKVHWSCACCYGILVRAVQSFNPTQPERFFYSITHCELLNNMCYTFCSCIYCTPNSINSQEKWSITFLM